MEDQHRERRKDQVYFMKVLEDQNDILAAQNLLLKEILGFIKPVAVFLGAMKSFVVFVSFILGLGAAMYWFWDWLKDFIKHH